MGQGNFQNLHANWVAVADIRLTSHDRDALHYLLKLQYIHVSVSAVMIPGNTQHFQEKCAGKHTLPSTDYLECAHPDPSEDYTLIAK